MLKLKKIIIPLLLLFTSFLFAKGVLADSISVIISNPSLSKDTITGNGSTGFSFDFAVPNSAKSGDTTVISLPDELNYQQDQTFNVYTSDGKTVVASAVINRATKTMTLTYTNYVNTHNDITGHIDTQVVIDRSVVTKSTTVPATIVVNGNTVTIDSNGIGYDVGTGDADNDFYKYGIINYDTNEITYVINVNTSNSSVSNAIITDTLQSANLSYIKDSLTIQRGEWYKNTQNYWSLKNLTDVTNDYTTDMSGNSFTLNLGNITEGFSISYKVKIGYNAVNGEKFLNSASYTSDQNKTNTWDSTVVYQSASGTATGYNYGLTVKKVDEDGQVLAGAEFTITRQSTGQVVGTITTGTDGTATINGLLKDKYTITETKAPTGYTIAAPITAEADNSTVTVTDKKATVEITGSKTWNDNNNQDGKRPKSIKVNLLANGTIIDTKTVTADNNWSYTFSNLNQYDTNGNEINYTVTEDSVDGYTTTVNGYDITNNHTPDTTEISGKKIWNDNNDQDGKRPKSIKINLLANGTIVDTQTITADNNWNYSFTNLPKYENGNEINYTITEDSVDGYTTSYDNYNVINSYTPSETSLTVTKKWDDNNNQDNLRPNSIQVQLYANGKKSGDVITLTAADKWTYTWTKLAKKSNKKDITYTVKEVSKIKGYTATVGEIKNGNVTITNTHVPKTPDKSPKNDSSTPPNNNSDKKNDNTSTLLPSTGDRSGLNLSILGLVSLAMIIIGTFYYQIKKHN